MQKNQVSVSKKNQKSFFSILKNCVIVVKRKDPARVNPYNYSQTRLNPFYKGTFYNNGKAQPVMIVGNSQKKVEKYLRIA